MSIKGCPRPDGQPCRSMHNSTYVTFYKGQFPKNISYTHTGWQKYSGTQILLTLRWDLRRKARQVETLYIRRNSHFDVDIICVPEYLGHPVANWSICPTYNLLQSLQPYWCVPGRPCPRRVGGQEHKRRGRRRRVRQQRHLWGRHLLSKAQE